MHMSECEAKKIIYHLKLKGVFNNAPSVPNIFSFHHLQVIQDKVVSFCTSEESTIVPEIV